MPVIKFNETGTHIQHGYLKVRVDIYPSPSDKTYPIHYVDKPIIPSEGYQGEVDARGNPVDREGYNSWIENLPTKKELNPCLCHFIKIDLETTLGELVAEIGGIFDPDTLSQLDDLLSDLDKPGNRARVALLMKPKAGKGKALLPPIAVEKLKEVVNKRFAGIEIEV